jgi:carboxypeptidase C (cathepsin A)
MLFVEQPAGVGFSYSENASDYTVGDARAAADVVSFFYGFFAAFPRYANTPLRISGESYGERGLLLPWRGCQCALSLYR